jgi:hypothetical protein
MSKPLDIIIVERTGILKILSIKDFKEEELYKKCGFKKAEDFNLQTTWPVKCDGIHYSIQLFAKIEGRPNSENKYDFPPPIDTKLFYGSCAIVGKLKPTNGSNENNYENLTIPIWTKIYEKLFGGFEDLAATAKEDEEEEDELANVPKDKKTKHGYLKDGFVVDSSDNDEKSVSATESSGFEDDDEDDDDADADAELEENLVVEDVDDDKGEEVGSELSEEEYL